MPVLVNLASIVIPAVALNADVFFVPPTYHPSNAYSHAVVLVAGVAVIVTVDEEYFPFANVYIVALIVLPLTLIDLYALIVPLRFDLFTEP